jgi:hypothetical protein
LQHPFLENYVLLAGAARAVLIDSAAWQSLLENNIFGIPGAVTLQSNKLITQLNKAIGG